MNAQKRTGQNIGAKMRRLMLAVFVLCFFASVALLSGGFGAGTGGEGAGVKLAGDTHIEWSKYNDSQLMDGLGDGGTAETAWLIGNAAQLKDLANQVNGAGSYLTADTLSGKYIKLTADIDLSELPDYNVGAGWTPIGNYSTSAITFRGSFDGGGFEVSNLYINITSATGDTYAGLFGCIEIGGAISNLGVSGSVTVSITYNHFCAGGIAGYFYGGSITNCYNTATVSASSNNNAVNGNAGGIAGYFSNGSITDSYNTAAVSASASYTSVGSGVGVSAGGIAGFTYIDSIITNSYNTGAVSANANYHITYAGGIVGYAGAGGTIDINNSYNTGAVSASAGGDYAYAGGILGYSVSNVGVITNSYNTGAVSANANNYHITYAGGVTGYIYAGSITNSYNTAAVSAISNGNNVYAGGVAGYIIVGDITNGYNMGAVSANGDAVNFVGGIAGLIYNESITNGYNTGAVSANGGSENYAGGIAGYSGGSSGSSITGSYSAGTVNATGGTSYAGGIAGHDNGGTITSSYYSSTKFSGTAVGNNGATLPAAGLSTAAMTAADALTTMTGLNSTSAFLKRENAVGILYYPELADFYNSTNEAVKAASELSVAISSTGGEVYTISYGLNGGTNDDSNPNVYSAESTDITLEAATRNDYIFGGWYTDEGLTSPVTDVAIPAGTTGAKTFYAKWLQEYAITYNNVNEATNGNPVTYTTGDDDITLEAATRNGYIFGGWYTDAGLTTAVTDVAITAGSTGNKTFWAKWTAIEYTITYNNVNEATNSNQVSYTIESNITLADLGARTGYAFGGWYTTEDFSGDKVTSIAAGATGNKTFYAKWTAVAGGNMIILIIIIVVVAALLVVAIMMVRRDRRKKRATATAAATTTTATTTAATAQTYPQNNQYGQNPYGQQQPNPYVQQQNSYGQYNPYGQQPNPYVQQNPYAQQQQNPYGQSNPYAPSNPYSQPQQGQQNPYDRNNPYNQNGKH